MFYRFDKKFNDGLNVWKMNIETWFWMFQYMYENCITNSTNLTR